MKPTFIQKIIIKRILKSQAMKTILVNWKSSLGGLGAILGALATIANVLQDGFEPDDLKIIYAAVSAISIGFAGLVARDADKSSQDSGVRD